MISVWYGILVIFPGLIIIWKAWKWLTSELKCWEGRCVFHSNWKLLVPWFGVLLFNCTLSVMVSSPWCTVLKCHVFHSMHISVCCREMLLMKWKLNKYSMMLQSCHFRRGVILPMFRFEVLSLCTGLKIFQLWCQSHP